MDVEHVVEATWVMYGGTPYEYREVVEAKQSSLAQAIAWAKHMRETYKNPDESRADRQYVEDAIARTDIIPPDNSPDLDTVLDTIIYNEVYQEED